MPAIFLTILLAFALASFVGGHNIPNKTHHPDRQAVSFHFVCNAISSAISPQSSVFFPGSIAYQKDISHWSVSSSQESACTVEPGTVEDLGKILQILGKFRTLFAVKSGGHATNPGFSSTEGVQIAMFRFSDVKFDPTSQTAVIGTGLIFDDVYAALAPHGVSVLGGRVTGIGVGGFILGGGYSWKSNQHGLAVDTVIAYELVQPNGTVTTVTEASDCELFFGLKGGFNNFGIVTRVTMKTFPQTSIWGGIITYLEPSIPAVSKAVSKFSSTNTDPKANLVATYNCLAFQPSISLIIFYDAPTLPKGTFQDFLNIPSILNLAHERSLVDFIQNSAANLTSMFRGVFNTVPLLEFSPNILRVIEDEVISACHGLLLESETFISYDVEPFLPTVLSHNTNPSAYPPTRNKAFFPFNIYFAWLLKPFDKDLFDAIKKSATRIRDAAVAEGQDILNAPKYPNYAIFDTPLNEMYGNNVDKLHALKKRVDPCNVMGLAGGFKF